MRRPEPRRGPVRLLSLVVVLALVAGAGRGALGHRVGAQTAGQVVPVQLLCSAPAVAAAAAITVQVDQAVTCAPVTALTTSGPITTTTTADTYSFGDSATGTTPTHTYLRPGVYTVTFARLVCAPPLPNTRGAAVCTTLSGSATVTVAQVLQASRFFGSVLFNGLAAPQGATILALINGVRCGSSSVTTTGLFAVDVGGPATAAGCNTTNASVAFAVNGVIAAQTATFLAGGFNQVNLTAGQAATGSSRFTGAATIDNAPADADATVTALINGVRCATALVQNGRYQLDVPSSAQQPGCGAAGAIVTFMLNGLAVSQTAVFLAGATATVNLAAFGGPIVPVQPATPTPATPAPTPATPTPATPATPTPTPEAPTPAPSPSPTPTPAASAPPLPPPQSTSPAPTPAPTLPPATAAPTPSAPPPTTPSPTPTPTPPPATPTPTPLPAPLSAGEQRGLAAQTTVSYLSGATQLATGQALVVRVISTVRNTLSGPVDYSDTVVYDLGDGVSVVGVPTADRGVVTTSAAQVRWGSFILGPGESNTLTFDLSLVPSACATRQSVVLITEIATTARTAAGSFTVMSGPIATDAVSGLAIGGVCAAGAGVPGIMPTSAAPSAAVPGTATAPAGGQSVAPAIPSATRPVAGTQPVAGMPRTGAGLVADQETGAALPMLVAALLLVAGGGAAARRRRGRA